METTTDQTTVPLTIRPTGDRIIITPPELKPADSGTRMVGELHIPDSVNLGGLSKWSEAVGRHHITTALEVGEKCALVKKGDRIVVANPGIFYVNSGDVRFCACQETSVVAVLG